VDEETNRIRRHIDTEREQLGRNLDEIEDRVKEATDLKTHFNKNTGWFLGAAVAGGFLLSRAFPAKHGSVDIPQSSRNAMLPSLPSRLDRVSETLDDIFEGLVAMASYKLQSFVSDAIPGFKEQYDAIERQRGRSSMHRESA